MWLKIAVTSVVIMTGAHWALVAHKKHAIERLTPLETGETFAVPIHGGFAPPPTCWTAIFIDPDCRGCQRMAQVVGPDHGVTERVNLYWVSAADRDETTEFAETYAIPATRILTVEAAKHAAPGTILRRLGMRGIPTRVTIGSDRRIRDIRLGAPPPADSLFSHVCAASGDVSLRE